MMWRWLSRESYGGAHLILNSIPEVERPSAGDVDMAHSGAIESVLSVNTAFCVLPLGARW